MNAWGLNTWNFAPLVNSQWPLRLQQTGYQTTTMNSHFTTQTTLNTLVDEDYRLGRGILDDFRPNAYKTQIGVVGNTTTNVITSSAIPNVTTPVESTTANVGGNDWTFLLLLLKWKLIFICYNNKYS